MNYKVSGALRRSKKYFIIYAAIWLVIALLLTPALTYAYHVSQIPSSNSFQVAVQEFARTITNPIEGFRCVFRSQIFGKYFSLLLVETVMYTIFFAIGFIKAAPKNEFTDIEHGSSDWCKNGEQYTVLSKKSGMILAENNYLPLDKRGNLNVLIVGRIWYW